MWGTSPDNNTYAGRSCVRTSNCEYGLVCTAGICLIPAGSSCSGSKNQGYCVPSCACVNGVCVPIRPYFV